MSEYARPTPRTEKLRAALVSSGYGDEAALRTAIDLAALSPDKHQDLYLAVEAWLAGTFPLPDVSDGPYSAASLVSRYGMSYPAALVTLGWLRDDPSPARECLLSRGEA